jgi:ribonuclease Z
MKLQFLGTASGLPTTRRNVSACALQWDQASDWWLIDCGEGTQQRLLRSRFTLAKLSRIFLTHLHGDHCFGLPGLLASRGLQAGHAAHVNLPLIVHGPVGLRSFVEGVFASTHTRLPTGVQLLEYGAEGGVLVDESTRTVSACPVPHRGAAYGFIIQEKPRPGHFKADEAKALGIPFGPLYGKLKNGESITLDDGRVIDGKTLVEPPRPGRKLVWSGDTRDAKNLVAPGQGACLLVHEATFSAEDEALAAERGHSTSRKAGEIARAMQVKRLVLTHFSPRYDRRPDDPEGGPTIEDLCREASEAYGCTEVVAAHDYLELEIPGY